MWEISVINEQFVVQHNGKKLAQFDNYKEARELIQQVQQTRR